MFRLACLRLNRGVQSLPFPSLGSLEFGFLFLDERHRFFVSRSVPTSQHSRRMRDTIPGADFDQFSAAAEDAVQITVSVSEELFNRLRCRVLPFVAFHQFAVERRLRFAGIAASSSLE